LQPTVSLTAHSGPRTTGESATAKKKPLMRLPTELWIKAYLRGLSAQGIFAAVFKHGDDDLGTIWVKVNCLNGQAILLGPAPEPLHETTPDRQWLRMHKAATVTDADADTQLARACAFDSDLWIIEIEDRAGRHGLNDWLVAEPGP
jgi:hypothetical protein